MRDLVGGGDDVGDVGVAGLAQRGGDADGDRVALGQDGEVGPGREAVAERGQRLVRHVFNVRRTAIDAVDARLVEVDAADPEAGLGEDDGQRQADVAQADDADGGGAVGELFKK